MTPIPKGPMIVHNNTAHMTIKNSSELLPPPSCCTSPEVDVVEEEEEEEGEAKIPVLSAREEIRNPISPRAHIAVPSMAEGYRDRGLGMRKSLAGCECSFLGALTLSWGGAAGGIVEVLPSCWFEGRVFGPDSGVGFVLVTFC